MRRIAGVASFVVVLSLAASARAQQVPPLTVPAFGNFNSVLAQGEGTQLNAFDFAQYEASGQPPSVFTNQQPLYVGIEPRAASLQPGDIDNFYKRTDFGTMPGGVGSEESPKPGVEIFRDKTYGMAHIYGDTRGGVMFGAGYATAEERLFAMDALRHAAKGTLAELTGPDGASMDRQQLTDQDFTDDELHKQFDDLPKKFGAEGVRGQQDVLQYIAGINQRIAEDNSDPTKLPAEYAALNVTPKPWDVTDTAAMAVLLVTQFTVSNGGEERLAQMRQAFQHRFGKRWRRPFHDLREAQDPEAWTVAHATFRSDQPGRVRKGRNLIPDFGSIKTFNPQVSGTGSASPSSTAAWVRTTNRLKAALPDVESNAVLVSPKLSKDGKPLWAAGPQVGYWSPQIFSEYELHGGGIDVEGVTFPGASPWPLIGHGIDFAWSGTSANGDNQDTFVETLCNTDGSAPTQASRAYMYKGKCTPFLTRDITVTTPPPSAGNMNPQETITYRPLRSVHGPVFAFATVGGKPVALTKAKGVDFRELDAVIPFMRLAENQPTNYKTFAQTFGIFPGTENWFYVDNKDVGFIQSGVYPKHAKGSNVDLPFNGDGKGDWQNFNPDNYTFKFISPSHRPRAVDTKQPIIISWNNKEAPGWRKGPTEWSNGPVHHAMILYRYLKDEIKAGDGKTDLLGLTKAVNEAASTDLRGEEDYPWMRRVIGKASGNDGAMLKLLDDWHAAGSHRLDDNGDGFYEHGAAVALFDEWWTDFVRAEFTPALGNDLLKRLEGDFLPLGGVNQDFGWAWASQVQKDLRTTLGRKERGRYSRRYCGRRPHCRQTLLQTLRDAAATVANRYDSGNPADWKVPTLCEQKDPPICDQEVPTDLGAVDTPAFPWQNRGTYHQVVELSGHR